MQPTNQGGTTTDRIGAIRRTLTTLIATTIILATLTAPPSYAAHSHWWHKTHPWVGTGWKRNALCVHRYEGSWTDPNPLYYGGMQMNESFMAAYGPWMLHHYGTADHWPVNGQLYASWKAWQLRGWSPWPQTARMCGLL